jgi:hypothetical protein
MILGMLELALREPLYVERALVSKDWANEVTRLKVVVEHGAIEISWVDPTAADDYYSGYQHLTILLVAGNSKLVDFLNAVEWEFVLEENMRAFKVATNA